MRPIPFKTYFMRLAVPQRDAFAARCGTSRGHLTNCAYNLKPCSPELAIQIERESGGRVRVESIRPDVDWKVIRRCACIPCKTRKGNRGEREAHPVTVDQSRGD